MSAWGVNISPGGWWRAAHRGVCMALTTLNVGVFFPQILVLQRCNLLFLCCLAVTAEVQLGMCCLWLDGFQGTEVPG